MCEPLNESPSEKEGKFVSAVVERGETVAPSMKVPPKRKGNQSRSPSLARQMTLNESPSEKEGK